MRRTVRNRRCYGLCAAMLLCSNLAWAQADRGQAARHFEQGLRLVEQHSYAQAIPEFEAAYRLSPHPTALYNLGQAYVALNKPTRAVQVFRRMLEEHEGTIDEPQRKAVLGLIQQQRAKLGKITIAVDPANARIDIDGERLRTPPGGDGVELDPGPHVVELSAEGRRPRKLTVQVLSGKTHTLQVYLQDNVSAAQHGALLQIDCDIPDVSVEIDGVRMGHTPLGDSLLLDAEPHRLRLSRPGYLEQSLVIELQAREHRRLRCDLRSAATAKGKGRLSVELNEPDAQLWLDGNVFAGGAVPAGRHRLRVEHWGFEPWERFVSVTPGGNRVVEVKLEPRPSYARQHRRINSERRTWSYVLGGAGLAFAGTAAALFVYNADRADAWQTKQDALDKEWTLVPQPLSLEDRQDENNQLSDSIQLLDKVTVGLATAGTLLVAGGIGLFVSSEDPDRYGRVGVGGAGSPAGLHWQGTW